MYIIILEYKSYIIIYKIRFLIRILVNLLFKHSNYNINYYLKIKMKYQNIIFKIRNPFYYLLPKYYF